MPGEASEELSIYRRQNAICETTNVGCFEPIVNAANVTGSEAGAKTAFGGQLEYIKATSDLAHIVLKTPVRLTETAPGEEAEGLYEWSAQKPPAEQLAFISLLPPNSKNEVKPAGEARLGNDQEGGEYQSARNAISKDGRRVYWTGTKVLPGEHTVRYLFMRDTSTNTTLQVNAVEEGCSCKESKGVAAEESNRVHFQMASEDGSRVFFTSTEPLTSDSKLKPKKEGLKPTDLYVCEIVEKEGKPACDLTDLTAAFAGPGEVAGEVIGASAEGTTVYFVANGALAGGVKGGCRLPEGEPVEPTAKCNLYVDHYNAGSQKWEEPKLITVLSEEDSADSSGARSPVVPVEPDGPRQPQRAIPGVHVQQSAYQLRQPRREPRSGGSQRRGGLPLRRERRNGTDPVRLVQSEPRAAPLGRARPEIRGRRTEPAGRPRRRVGRKMARRLDPRLDAAQQRQRTAVSVALPARRRAAVLQQRRLARFRRYEPSSGDDQRSRGGMGVEDVYEYEPAASGAARARAPAFRCSPRAQPPRNRASWMPA